MIQYFAYGSNLHTMRLMERVPSAKLIGTATLDGHCLTFHKRSNDGSSKCNMLETGDASDEIHGAIYEISPEHNSILDGFEGKGYGYINNQIGLSHQDHEYLCFTYLAQQSHIVDDLKPYHWYKEMVVIGSKYLGFPEAYVASIDSVESTEDPDHKRMLEKEALLGKMRNFH